MVTPPEATPRNRQTTKSPPADTRVPGATHAVEIPKLPASSRKRAPPEDLIDIKVEDDGGVLSTPLAAASHAAKRRKAGHVRQPDLARPGLPLTPLSDRCRLQTTASPPIAASGPSQANISPLSPPSSKKPLRRRTLDDAFDRDSAYKSDDEIVAVEDSPQIVLQSVEPDDVQLGEDDMSISSKLMQQIQSNTSMQGSEDDQVEVQLSQNTKKRSRIKGLAPESNPDDDAPEDWRREQIMLNAVLKARDEFSLLPSSWKVHFSGGPSTDRMFYRRVKEKSFRPRIYARCEKYEITGAHHLRSMMQVSLRVRDLRIAQGRVARDPTKQQAVRDADQARLSKAITKKIHKILTDAIHWSKVDGGLDVFGDQLPPNVAILHVSAVASVSETQAKMDNHMEKLAQSWRDRFASLDSQTVPETAPLPLEPVLHAFIIMNHLVLIATKDAATPNAPIHIPVRIDMGKPLQQSWNALGLMVTICWARDKLMEAAAALKLEVRQARKEDSDPDA